MQQCRYVGRLDLTGAALDNYIDALISDWSSSTIRYQAPLVWSVDAGPGDITGLMRAAIASRVAAKMRDDPDMPDLAYLAGDGTPTTYDAQRTGGTSPTIDGPATTAELRARLTTARPAVIVTTSHGQTSPLGDAAAMLRDLGLPVDQHHHLLNPGELLRDWQPDGAIWYAHACASAGADGTNPFNGLVDPDSLTARVLDAVAALGPHTAPLPTALLGATRPLRAFIGHVHPTFSWTLRMDQIRRVLTAGLVTSLYTGVCAGEPVGHALDRFFREAGPLWQQRWDAQTRYNHTADAQYIWAAAYAGLTALDRATTVILGDPTVAIPIPRT